MLSASLLWSAIASALALLLAFAGGIKLLHSAEFLAVLSGYGAVPRWQVGPLSRLVPIVEVILALLLLLPSVRTVGAFGAAGLFWLMAAVVALSLLGGQVPEQCGCFGRFDGRPSWLTILRALGLATAALGVGVASVPDAAGIEAVLVPALAISASVMVLSARAVRTAAQ